MGRRAWELLRTSAYGVTTQRSPPDASALTNSCLIGIVGGNPRVEWPETFVWGCLSGVRNPPKTTLADRRSCAVLRWKKGSL